MSSSRFSFSKAFLASAAFGLAAATVAHAATYQWDTNGTTAGLGGTGNWNTTTPNWDNFGTGGNTGTDGTTNYTFTNVDTALFGGTAGTVTLTTGVTLNALVFNTDSYLVSGNILTLAGSSPGITVTNFAEIATIGSIVSGSNGLTKRGAGTLVLTNTNNYTGGTTVSAGELRAGSSTAFGTGGITVNTGATLALNGFNLSNAILGTGTVDITNSTLTLGAGNASTTFAGSITGANGNLIKVGSGTVSLSGSILDYTGTTTVSGGTLRLTGSASLDSGFHTGDIIVAGGATFEDNSSSFQEYAGVISGAGSVAYTGNGSYWISGANTYTGNTTVSGSAFVYVDSDSAFGVNSAVNVVGNGYVRMNENLSVGSLAGSGTVSVGEHTLTITGSSAAPTAYFSGSLDAAQVFDFVYPGVPRTDPFVPPNAPPAPATDNPPAGAPTTATTYSGHYKLDSDGFRILDTAGGTINKNGTGAWELNVFASNLDGATLNVNAGELRVNSMLHRVNHEFITFDGSPLSTTAPVVTGGFTNSGAWLLGVGDTTQFIRQGDDIIIMDTGIFLDTATRTVTTLATGNAVDSTYRYSYYGDAITGPASVTVAAGARLSFQNTQSGIYLNNIPVVLYNGVRNIQGHRDSELQTGLLDNIRIAVDTPLLTDTATIGKLSGTGRFFKTGAGTLTVLNESTFTGDILLARGETVLDSANGKALRSASSVNLGNDGNNRLLDGNNGTGTGNSGWMKYSWTNTANNKTITSTADFSGWGSVTLRLNNNQEIGSLQVYRDPRQYNTTTNAYEQLVTGIDPNHPLDLTGLGDDTTIELGGNTLKVNQTKLGYYVGSILGGSGSVFEKSGDADLVLLCESNSVDTLRVSQGRVLTNVDGLGNRLEIVDGAGVEIIQNHNGTLRTPLSVDVDSTLNIGAGVEFNGSQLRGDDHPESGTQYFETSFVGAVDIVTVQSNFFGTLQISDGIHLLLAGNPNALANAKSIVINDHLVALGQAGRTTLIDFKDTDQVLNNLLDKTATQNGSTWTSFARLDLGKGSLRLNQTLADTTTELYSQYAGEITGSGALIKMGDKDFTVLNAVTYTGPTVVENGTLKGAATNTFGASGALVVSHTGTFDANGKDQTFGALFGASGASVNMGAGNLTLGMNATAEAVARAASVDDLFAAPNTHVHTILATDANSDATVAGSARTIAYLTARYAEAVDRSSTLFTDAFANVDTSSSIYTNALATSDRLISDVYKTALGDSARTSDSIYTNAAADTTGQGASTLYDDALSNPNTNSTVYTAALSSPDTGDSTYTSTYTQSYQAAIDSGSSPSSADTVARAAAARAYAAKAYAVDAYASDAFASVSYAKDAYAANAYAENAAADMTFAGVISGTGKLIKTGSQTLTLSGQNTYTGDTVVQGGMLTVNPGTLYNGSITPGRVLLSTGTTLGVIATDTVNAEQLQNTVVYGGSGATFRKLGAGILELDVSKFLLADDSGNPVANATTGFTGLIDVYEGTLQFNAPGTTDIALTGSVTGSGDIRKIGTGSVSLGNATLFAGNYDVREGTLIASTSAASITNLVTVASGSTMVISLAGAGAHDYAGTLTGDGTVRFSGQPVTMSTTQATFTGTLSLGGNASLTASTDNIAEFATLDLSGIPASAPGVTPVLPAMSATFSDGGFAQTFTGLTGNAQGVYQLAGTTTLNVGATPTSYDGAITGAGTLVVGTGHQKLTTTTANTGWTGGVQVNNGALLESTVEAISNLSSINVDFGGELDVLVDPVSNSRTLNSTFTGAGTLGKTGAGTLTLGSGAAFSGSVLVKEGTLAVGGGSRGVGVNVYANTTVNRGATYQVTLDGSSATNTGLSGLVGEGALALTGPSTVALTGPQGAGATAHTGNILLSNFATLDLAANSVTVLNGLGSTTDTVGSPSGAAAGTVVSGANLTIAQSADATYRGVFSGLQNLTVTVGNDVANTAGTLTYDNGPLTLQTVTVQGGKMITTDAVNVQDVTVNQGGTLTTGGDLHVDGGVTNLVSVTGAGSVLTVGQNLTGVANVSVTAGGTLRILGEDLATGYIKITDGTLSLTSIPVSRQYELSNATLDLNTINAGDTLTLNNTVTVLANVSTLSKSGDGTLIVRGTVVPTAGPINLLVNAGTMQLDSDTAFGATNTVGTITVKRDTTAPLTGGTLNLDGHSLTGTTLTTEVGTTISLGNSAATTLTVTDGTIAGSITGTGSFVKNGGGVLTYAANDVIADTVAVVINAGTLALNGHSDNLGTLNVAAAGNVTLGTGTLGVQSGTIAGTITGSGSLVKNGSGTLTLSASGNSVGSTAVNGGTLALTAGSLTTGTLNTTGTGVVALSGANLTVNSGAFAATLNGGGTLALGTSTMTVSQTGNFSGTMTGSGNLVKNGTGTTLTLSGSNNKLNSATVNAGTLAFTGVGNTVGTLEGLGVVNLGSGARLTLQPTSTNTFAGTFTGSGEMTKTGAGTFIVTGDSSAFTGKLTVNTGILQIGSGGTTGGLGTAALVNNSTVVINRSDAVVTIDNLISGTGSLIKSGSNTNTVILTANNTYAGTTTIQGGTLQIGNGGTTGALGSLVNPGAVINSGALVFNRADNLTVGNAISGTGSVTQSGGANSTVTLSGANTYTGNTGVTSGKLIVKTASLPQGTFSSTGTGSLTFDGTGAATIAKDISGTSDVNFSGAGGTTTLSGAFTNTGNFTVLSGHTLKLGTDDANRASLATQNLLISAGATLRGSGSFSGNLSNSGTLAPGFSPGVINVAGDFTNTGTLNMEIAGNGAAGATDGHDQINFGGTAFLGGTLNVTFTNGFTPATGATIILLQDTNTNDGQPSFSGNFVSMVLPTGMLVNTGSALAFFNGDSLTQTIGLPELSDGVAAFAAALSPRQGVVNPAFGHFLTLSNDPAALAIALQNASPVGLAALTALPVSEVVKDAESLRRRAESQAMAAYTPFGDEADWLTYVGGSGGTTNYDDKSSLPTFDTQSFGGLAGVERRLGDGSASLGVRLGYDRGAATLHNGGGKVDQDHARVGVYGMALLGDAAYMTGGIGMGYSSYETKRNTISGVQKASPTGWDISASVDAGYIARLNKEWSLTPHIGLSAVSANVGGFTEKGSDLALAVDGYSQTSVRTRIGTGLYREWNAKNFTRNSVRLGLDISYEHELMDDSVKIPASFANFPQGGSFKSESAALVRDTIAIGPQLEWAMDESSSISAGYRFEYGFGGSTGNRVDISFEQRF